MSASSSEDQGCVYLVVHADRPHHDGLIRDLVDPVAAELRDDAELDSLFFVRFDVPAWHLRFRVLGRRPWIDDRVRPLVEKSLPSVRSREYVRGVDFDEYVREYDRYGGPEGVALAETLFLHDSLACLDLMRLERDGRLRRSRREYHLALTERLLDLMHLEGPPRAAFYEHGYRWTIETDTWKDEDFATLEERFRSLRSGLAALADGADDVSVWGGEETAALAREFLGHARPVLERVLAAHAAGRVRQDLAYLAWSYAHLSANRLGIDPPAEAILRFFMHRLHRERHGG